MSNRSTYHLKCTDGVARQVNEADLAPALRMWGWATPEEAEAMRKAIGPRGPGQGERGAAIRNPIDLEAWRREAVAIHNDPTRRDGGTFGLILVALERALDELEATRNERDALR
jgi:hypothetical protein